MKVKIFTDEGDATKLEKELNEWLSKNSKIVISHIKQTYSYDNTNSFYTLISIWYEEK